MVSYAGTVTSVHFVRSQPTPVSEWPVVTLTSGPATGNSPPPAPVVYTGPKTTAGLKKVRPVPVCSLYTGLGFRV